MPAPKSSRPLKHFYEVPRDLLSRKGVETRRHVHGLTGTLIIGDDTGLIKVVSCKKKKVIKIWGQQNPVKKIQKLYWAHPRIINGHNADHSHSIPMEDVMNAQKEFLAVLSNGDIRLFNTHVGSFTTVIKQEVNIKGVHVMNNPLLNDNESNHKRMIWTLTENGDCRLWGIDYDKHRFIDQYQNDKIRLPTDSMIMNKLPPKSAKKKKKEDPFINLLKSQSKKNKDKSMDRGVLLSYFNVNTIQTKNKLERNGTIVSNYQANKSRKFQEMQKTKKFRKKIFPTKYGMNKGKINCMKGHYDVTQFPWIAIGGNERPVEVYDFNKQKCIFKGKHHKHWLGHRHEIIINDIDFCKKSVNPYLCAAVTQQSDLKLYDVRANKSIFAQKIGDYSLNKVLIKSKQKILIGDSNANIFEFDYLKPSRERGYVYRRYRGFVGAIRDFDIHPTRNLLATVGLGRYVVVHRLNQPHLPLFKTYCKQKLNAVLFGATYDTKYLPKEEIEEKNDDEKEENKSENNEVDNFLDDTEDEEEEEEDENQDEDEDLDESEENGDDDKRSYLLEALADDDDDGDWNERLDGYDTDELEDLLEEMKNQRQFQHDGPPSKRRKMR